MTFEYDIFISYGHLDDEDPAGGMKGWVDLLVERLPRHVAYNVGYAPRVWRDERSLRGNDLLQEAIVGGVARSRLFVPVVTPRYVLSDWCRRELETFCASGATAGPHRSRIFKIVKTPLLLPHLKEPEVLRNLLGYDFYEMEGERPREFCTDEGPPYKDQKYWNTLARLAWDIAYTLSSMSEGSGRQPTPAPARGFVSSPVSSPASSPALVAAQPPAAAATGGNGDGAKLVYLAETAPDLKSLREEVRDELRQRNYGVLPEETLPREERSQTEEAVRAALARCCLSVHMVGAKYGELPDDDPASVVQIQEALAAERGAAEGSFRRLLWMPPALVAAEIKDARQRAFVEGLQTRVNAGTELLQTTIEDLKTRIVEKLAPPQKAQAASAAPARGPKFKQVYLICDDSDRSFVRPIKQYLFKEQIEVVTWLDGAGGDSERLMEYHRKNLRECDAALIYFGNGDEPWVRKNIEDLEKALGYGREEDWAASAVYVGAPADERKEDFYTLKVPYVIHNFSEFNPENLRSFVDAVRSAEGGQR